MATVSGDVASPETHFLKKTPVTRLNQMGDYAEDIKKHNQNVTDEYRKFYGDISYFTNRGNSIGSWETIDKK